MNLSFAKVLNRLLQVLDTWTPFSFGFQNAFSFGFHLHCGADVFGMIQSDDEGYRFQAPYL